MITIRNEKNKQIKDVLGEMNSIWKKYKNGIYNVNKVFNDVIAQHKELYEAYPTVLKHMIHENKYSSQAFYIYLKKLQKKPWLSDVERMQSYADYYIILYKLTHRWHPKEIPKLRTDYFNTLKKGHDDFMAKYELSKKIIDDRETNREHERVNEALGQFKKLAAGRIDQQKIDKIITMANNNMMSVDHLETLNFQLYMDGLPPS